LQHNLSANNFTHLEDWQIKRNNQAANNRTNHDHNKRLEQATQCINGVIDLFFIEINDDMLSSMTNR